ncbi:MAG: hypothetical protein QXX30_01650 [Candidatus Aenigmatarchaeota archaeon]
MREGVIVVDRRELFAEEINSLFTQTLSEFLYSGRNNVELIKDIKYYFFDKFLGYSFYQTLKRLSFKGESKVFFDLVKLLENSNGVYSGKFFIFEGGKENIINFWGEFFLEFVNRLNKHVFENSFNKNNKKFFTLNVFNPFDRLSDIVIVEDTDIYSSTNPLGSFELTPTLAFVFKTENTTFYSNPIFVPAYFVGRIKIFERMSLEEKIDFVFDILGGTYYFISKERRKQIIENYYKGIMELFMSMSFNIFYEKFPHQQIFWSYIAKNIDGFIKDESFNINVHFSKIPLISVSFKGVVFPGYFIKNLEANFSQDTNDVPDDYLIIKDKKELGPMLIIDPFKSIDFLSGMNYRTNNVNTKIKDLYYMNKSSVKNQVSFGNLHFLGKNLRMHYGRSMEPITLFFPGIFVEVYEDLI